MDKKEYKNMYFTVNKMEHKNFGEYGYSYVEDKDTVFCIYYCTSNNKYYLTKQPRPSSPEGVYDLIGGTIEKGENPTIALLRELQEEIGINISSINIEKIGTFNPNYCLFKDTKMHLFFVSSNENPCIENQNLDNDEKIELYSCSIIYDLFDKCRDLKSRIVYDYIEKKINSL